MNFLSHSPADTLPGMNAISKLRRARGWTQADLADAAGTTQATIARVERGFDGVTLRMLNDIAAALDVPTRDLLSDDRSDLEAILMQYFRGLSPDRQQGWIDVARHSLAETNGQTDP